MSRKPPVHWPPPYRITENPRARKVILRVRPPDGLVITIPKGFDRGLLPGILERHRSWIQTKLRCVHEGFSQKKPEEILPKTMDLAAIGESWDVTYAPHPGAPLELYWDVHPQPHICLRGDDSRLPAVCRLLRTWLQQYATRRLPPLVEQLSQKTKLPYRRLSIRCQKTRWGSYSNLGTLSLNAAVLFLPPHLARLVIVHELCHSTHRLHDTAFWNLLQKHEPDCRRLDAELRHDAHRFPRWYVASFE